jgi:hypothetical protein
VDCGSVHLQSEGVSVIHPPEVGQGGYALQGL